MSEPLPSDATLHWNLAILRGAMFNDGTAILPYKQQIKDVLRLLLDKTFSKRGFAWTGRLLFSVLLSCTHTYPLENRWVNPEEWYSAEFLHSHHKYWGKLYAPGEAKVDHGQLLIACNELNIGLQVVWHVPNGDEIAFAFEIFDELVVPTFDKLEALLGDDVARDAIWRNDFCRYLSFVRDAFSGIASLAKEEATEEERKVYYATSDLSYVLFLRLVLPT
jgi:proteasome activator subunit 4